MNIGAWTAIGVALGVVLSRSLGSEGIALGIAIGLAIGAATEYRRRRGSKDDTDTSDADEHRDD